jgi:cellulose synthase/poly-beta-1,6-N-acetylglucosamine synthase-like glycosyltransferase
MIRRIARATGWAARVGELAVTAYLATLTAAAVLTRARRPRTRPSGRAPHRFAILVPAHQEERVIERCVASLRALDYPPDHVDIHVVVDNSTDRTAELAAASGAEVHERHEPAHPGKGPALQWLLARIKDRGYDAYVFVDADTVVHPQLLRRFDEHLAAGAAVVQGHYRVADPASAPAVAFRAAAFAGRTFLRPLGRTAIGGTAGLHGNGMAFRADVMDTRRWSDHLTEDVELYLDLLLDGTLVEFAPEAEVEAEMPNTLEAARSQHERWERGRLQVLATYAPRLVARTLRGGPASRVAYADALMDQLVPPLSVVVAGSTAWAGLAGLGALLRPTRWRRLDAALAVTTVAVQGGYVLASLVLSGAPRSVYRGLLQAPRMLAWKLWLWFGVLLRPTGRTWVRTERN